MAIALKEIRKQMGIEAEDLAEMTGLSKQVIWSYEAGRSNPKPEELCKLADALGVSLDMLVRGKEKDRPFGRSIEELVQMFRGLSDEQLDYFTAVMQAVKADRRFQAHLRQDGKEGQ